MWSERDFQAVYEFLNDIRACLKDPAALVECRDILAEECARATHHPGRILDAVVLPSRVDGCRSARGQIG